MNFDVHFGSALSASPQGCKYNFTDWRICLVRIL